tara:strand:+ start:2384 stop:2959 length:576 start_codon:yes stop_codon:yes gene_type:complete
MSKRRPSPIHVGGPLGIAGIALLGSAVGLVFVANDEPDTPQPAIQQGSVVSPVKEPTTDPRPPIGSVGVEQVQSASTSKDAPAASGPAEVTFIVRLKGRPEVDTICRNYKRDRDTALAAFDDLAADIPALKEFKLVGASYSGEISLAYTLPAGVDATRGRIEEIRTRILSIDGVAYADPDFVAHPGEDKRK